MSKKYLNSSPALRPCRACSCRAPAPCGDGGGAAALPRGARGAHAARLGEPTSHGAPPGPSRHQRGCVAGGRATSHPTHFPGAGEGGAQPSPGTQEWLQSSQGSLQSPARGESEGAERAQSQTQASGPCRQACGDCLQPHALWEGAGGCRRATVLWGLQGGSATSTACCHRAGTLGCSTSVPHC